MKHVNNKGFSLIELMIVVAIIGILATVAIPNFQKFQGKAKQSEAKSQLGGFYMSQKAFYAEYSFYAGQFGAIGFVPQGKLNYKLKSGNNVANAGGVITGTNLPSSMDVAACVVTTAAACNAAAFGGTLPVWSENPPQATTATFTSAPVSTATTFLGAAASVVPNGAAANDEWTINQNNALINLVYGI